MDKNDKKPFETELTDDEMMEMTGGSTFIPIDGSITGNQPITMKYGIKVIKPTTKYGVTLYGIPVTKYGIPAIKYGYVIN